MRNAFKMDAQLSEPHRKFDLSACWWFAVYFFVRQNLQPVERFQGTQVVKSIISESHSAKEGAFLRLWVIKTSEKEYVRPAAGTRIIRRVKVSDTYFSPWHATCPAVGGRRVSGKRCVLYLTLLRLPSTGPEIRQDVKNVLQAAHQSDTEFCHHRASETTHHPGSCVSASDAARGVMRCRPTSRPA
jgi:hypothetical protein